MRGDEMERSELGWAFVWGVIIAVASSILVKYTGHGIGVAVLVCLVLAMSYLFVLMLKRRHRGESLRKCRRDMFFVGFLWLIMSIVTMFIGHYYINDSTDRFPWASYNILKGKLMALVLLSELTAPYIFGVVLLRHRRRSRTDKKG